MSAKTRNQDVFLDSDVGNYPAPCLHNASTATVKWKEVGQRLPLGVHAPSAAIGFLETLFVSLGQMQADLEHTERTGAQIPTLDLDGFRSPQFNIHPLQH